MPEAETPAAIQGIGREKQCFRALKPGSFTGWVIKVCYNKLQVNYGGKRCGSIKKYMRITNVWQGFSEPYPCEFGFFPLWCVPYKRVRDYEWIADDFWRGMQDELLIDIAIYGMKQRGDTNYYRLLEEKLQALNGAKTLISYNYYSEDEFWTIFHRENFAKVKAITDPDNIFRDLYQKTCRASMGRE